MVIRLLTSTILLAGAVTATQAQVPVVNPDFALGGDPPTGWTLNTGTGMVVAGDAGGRAVAIVGDGESSNRWESAPIDLVPGGIYRLTARGRSQGASGGTATMGVTWANLDLGTMPDDWRTYSLVFRAPVAAPATARIHLGQWHVNGTVMFGQVSLVPVQPVYQPVGADAFLGASEVLTGDNYSYHPAFGKDGPNSRALVNSTAGFNSSRWTMGANDEVIYRHHVDSRRQTGATLSVGIGHYTAGRLVVEASPDGQTWTQVGELSGLEGLTEPLPAALFPADEIWVRLRANDTASLQVYSYEYKATVDPAVDDAYHAGGTRYLAELSTVPGLDLTIVDAGAALPGLDNLLNATVGAAPAGTTLTVNVLDAAGQVVSAGDAHPLAAGPLALTYRVPTSGDWTVRLTSNNGYESELAVYVPALHRADYGALLPDSSDNVGLWWCSSGWKVSRLRGLPTEQADSLVIRTARNEAEAAQFVLRPTTDLTGLTVAVGDLAGPGGATLPATQVEVLQVGYVPIAQPTDSTGAVGDWPDPLPPIEGALNLRAETNQPFWVRVTCPTGQAPGLYRGAVQLNADAYQAHVPLEVEVFDLTLPDKLSCETAFGFSAGEVFAYHGLTTDEQRREVIDLYLQSFAAHRISPYNPAPLDPLRVTWQGGPDWTGGQADTEVVYAGRQSRRLTDDSPGGVVQLNFDRLIPIPAGGLRLEGYYRTASADEPTLVTLTHFDTSDTWMSGRNLDTRLPGSTEWQPFTIEATTFPEGATSVRLGLWATPWTEEGDLLGTTWYDDIRVTAIGDGTVLLSENFEDEDETAPVPVFDFSGWDVGLAKAFSEYHFSSIRLPAQGMGGGTFHDRVDPQIQGYGPETPQFQAAFRAYWEGIEDYLREKGWLDYAYTYWFDEPDPKDYQFVMDGMLRLKETVPDIRRMLTEQPEDELLGGPNLWCPLTPEYPDEEAAALRAAGDEFWWYVCTGPKAPYATLFIDKAATEMRVWLWQTWQRRIKGILVWQSNYWNSSVAYPDQRQNPYTDPMSWVSGYSTPSGTRSPWGNGDGRFYYPPQAAAAGDPAEPVIAGPVDSLRWEMLRDGLEDYEYLHMLATAIEQQPAAERAAYEPLLEVPAEVTSSLTSFTSDPTPIEARRLEIARALEAIGGR